MRSLRFLAIVAVVLAVLGATPSPRTVRHHPALYSKQLRKHACRAPRAISTPPTAPNGATVVTNGSTITTVQNRGTAVTQTSVCKP